jgi:hypothetical protein
MEEVCDIEPEEPFPPVASCCEITYEEIADFENLMRHIISSLLLESCELVCWVFDLKYNKGWTLEQMINQNRKTEQLIIAVDVLLDKYMGMQGKDKNVITS